jgi:hypothetical protein
MTDESTRWLNADDAEQFLSAVRACIGEYAVRSGRFGDAGFCRSLGNLQVGIDEATAEKRAIEAALEREGPDRWLHEAMTSTAPLWSETTFAWE